MDEPTSEERMRALHALAEGGCVAPDAEADALLRATSEGVGPIEELIARRLRGEPLAWITGSVRFCGVRVRVDPGVFVPRPHTQALARRAVSLLPAVGIAVDLCTGSGAVSPGSDLSDLCSRREGLGPRGVELARPGDLGVRGRGTQRELDRIRPAGLSLDPDDQTRKERVAACDRVTAPDVQHTLVEAPFGCSGDDTLRASRHDARVSGAAGELAELHGCGHRVLPMSRGNTEQTCDLRDVDLHDIRLRTQGEA
jgi:hypothetical protein